MNPLALLAMLPLLITLTYCASFFIGLPLRILDSLYHEESWSINKIALYGFIMLIISCALVAVLMILMELFFWGVNNL